MTRIDFTLERAIPTLNEWLRIQHNKHAKKKYMQGLAWEVKAALNGSESPAEPLEHCEVHIIRETSSALSLMDWDGLYGGCKPLLDVLVASSKRNPHGLGLIADDNMAVITQLTAEWRFRKRAEGERTQVSIIEVES